MPLYLFDCGAHRRERLAPLGTDIIACDECGASARRAFGGSIAIKHASASETVLPKHIRDAIDEATGYKREAIAAKQEAEANGFQIAQGR